MSSKLFILGLPGSGKSRAARNIEFHAKNYSLMPQRFRDYDILYRMYREDKEGKHFRSTEDRGYDGFDVIDSRAFDDALIELNRQILQRNRLAYEAKELLIIEFSRVDYCKALEFFATHLLKDTYILFIDSDIPTCIQRIKERVAKVSEERTEDDPYVSEYIFETYYKQDHRDYLNSIAIRLQVQFGLPKENIHVIHNGPTVSEQEFEERVRTLTKGILKQF
jgi:hypothetical protein